MYIQAPEEYSEFKKFIKRGSIYKVIMKNSGLKVGDVIHCYGSVYDYGREGQEGFLLYVDDRFIPISEVEVMQNPVKFFEKIGEFEPKKSRTDKTAN